MSRSICLPKVFAVVFLSFASVAPSDAASSGGLSEGLLVEAEAKSGAQEIAGRVLIEAGQTEWTTIATASGKGKKTVPGLRLEARANLLESDVVEIETRLTGADGRIEQNGKLLMRLGLSGKMSQMEEEAPAPHTSVEVKVLRVRYSL